MGIPVKTKLQVMRRRLKKSPWIADPSKGDICLLCGDDFYDCKKHSRRDVDDVVEHIRRLELIGE